MIQEQFLEPRAAFLSNYYKEQIHIPGAIQPHGVLLVLKEQDLEIVQVSNNTFVYLGLHPQNLLKTNLKNLINLQEFELIKKSIGEDLESCNPLKLSIKVRNKILAFNGFIHRLDKLIILEIEPIDYKNNDSISDFYRLIKPPITKMQNASNVQELCQMIVKEVRKITGFDRVMVYQFESEEAGVVIAEDKLERLSPFLGLHYPALDIPKQARHLFTLNWLRLIPDVNCQFVNLVPAHNPVTSQPLDLSYSILRSVSPCHIEYLKNMGVAAAMSISLIRDKKLWGLIACHHQSTNYLTYEMRTASELLGQVMSLELADKEDNESLDYKIKLKSIHSKFIEAIPQEQNFVDGLVKNESNLLDLVNAQGVAVYSDGELAIIGQTPEAADIHNLIEWAQTKIDNEIFYTD